MQKKPKQQIILNELQMFQTPLNHWITLWDWNYETQYCCHVLYNFFLPISRLFVCLLSLGNQGYFSKILFFNVGKKLIKTNSVLYVEILLLKILLSYNRCLVHLSFYNHKFKCMLSECENFIFPSTLISLPLQLYH